MNTADIVIIFILCVSVILGTVSSVKSKKKGGCCGDCGGCGIKCKKQSPK